MDRKLKYLIWVGSSLIVLTIVALAFKQFGTFLNKYGVAVTALATFIIAIFTIVLAFTNRQQARLTREAMIADKRAFVFAVDCFYLHERDDQTGLYNWRFRPKLRNSGDTPTKNMTTYTAFTLRSTPLPQGFNFNNPQMNITKGLIPPKFSVMGPQAPNQPDPAITPQDILDIEAERKCLYLWGWIRYRDVFPNTPQHITRFCWRIVCTGDPLAFKPGSPGLTFGFVHHEEANCADEECALYEGIPPK